MKRYIHKEYLLHKFKHKSDNLNESFCSLSCYQKVKIVIKDILSCLI